MLDLKDDKLLDSDYDDGYNDAKWISNVKERQRLVVHCSDRLCREPDHLGVPPPAEIFCCAIGFWKRESCSIWSRGLTDAARRPTVAPYDIICGPCLNMKD